MFGPEVLNGEEVTGKIRASLTRFVYTDFSAPNSPSLGIRISPFLLIQGGNLHMSFMICFKEEGQGGKVRRIF